LREARHTWQAATDDHGCDLGARTQGSNVNGVSEILGCEQRDGDNQLEYGDAKRAKPGWVSGVGITR
jgi:hypothetical protein